MKRKVIAIFMTIIMTLGLVACGSGDSGNKNVGTQTGSSNELDWSAGASADDGDVSIRFYTWRKSDEAYFKEIIKRFEEKYDWIDVELDINPNAGAYYSNLQADLIGGVGPDVFDMHSGETVVEYIKAGYLAPQTDFDYMQNYSETGQTATSLDGENYGFLIAYNYFGYLYNKAIFNKVGVSVPTTPEELVAAVNQLKNAGYGGVILTGKTLSTDAIGSSIMLGSMGTEGYTAFRQGIDDGSITDITAVDGVTQALETMKTYNANDVYYDAFRGIVHDAGLSLYAQEKSAIMYMGSYIFGEKDTYFPNVDSGFFPIPTYANNGVCYAEGAQVECINANSEKLGAAKLWVEFLASAEISEYYCSNAKMFSTIEGVNPQFEEMETIKNACSDYAIKPLEEFENESYWESGLETIYESLIYEGNEDISGLSRVYQSQLEEFAFAD